MINYLDNNHLEYVVNSTIDYINANNIDAIEDTDMVKDILEDYMDEVVCEIAVDDNGYKYGELTYVGKLNYIDELYTDLIKRMGKK